MTVHTAISPAPTTNRADEVRRRTIYAGRLAEAAQSFAYDYQGNPDLAVLNLCDALSFVLPDLDLGDFMQTCRDELQIDYEGYRVSKGSVARDPVRLEHWGRVFTPRGDVL